MCLPVPSPSASVHAPLLSPIRDIHRDMMMMMMKTYFFFRVYLFPLRICTFSLSVRLHDSDPDRSVDRGNPMQRNRSLNATHKPVAAGYGLHFESDTEYDYHF